MRALVYSLILCFGLTIGAPLLGTGQAQAEGTSVVKKPKRAKRVKRAKRAKRTKKAKRARRARRVKRVKKAPVGGE